jgi:hypothetical protein
MDDEKRVRAAGLERQQGRLKAALGQLDGLDHRFFLARLGSVIGGFVASFLALSFAPGPVGLGVTAAAVLIFGGVVWLHRRVDRRRRWLDLQCELAASQLARLRLDWPGIPHAAEPAFEATHAFAGDLNLFGEHSLHQLLDTATSRGGSQRLAGWLLEPVLDAEHIRQRQAILRELLPLSGFRRGLALQGMAIKAELKGYWDGEKLLGWLAGGAAPRSLLPALILLFGLVGVNALLFVLFTAGLLPAYWVGSLALYGAIYMSRYSDYKELFEDAYDLGKSLDQFRAILVYLEDYPYPRDSALGRLCAPFLQAERRPSRYLKGIVALTSAASLENNPMLGLLINLLVPWNLLFAYLLGRYKASLRGVLPGWLETWYELEALNSLANFSYLNPAYTFPEIVEGAQPLFEACRLGHPLIADEARVANDFALRRVGEVAIVTGSNMSGKSTFLRTLGINLCLGLAGGPVAAQQMRTGLVRLFTCIQVNDSLADGISYFYAEVRRLKALLVGLEKEDAHPLFFLIDEIFRGTNNRERQIGSRAYVRALAQGRGAGLISTHDLELVKLSEIGFDIHNYHFREEIHDGRMAFDYCLRPGPCPTTNALKIMALEGLPVEDGL